MIHAMKPGSVLVDLAAGRGPDENGTLHGGNCPLTRAGQTYQTENGVWIVGETNLAAQLASDASSLYARNILDFLKLITHGGALKIPEDDDIVNACLMTHAGVVKKP